MLPSFLLLAVLSVTNISGARLDVRVLDTGVNTAPARALADALPAPLIHVDGIETLTPRSLLVIISAGDFPSRGFAFVQNYLGKGGHLMIAGAPPFETPLYELNGRWLGEDELLSHVVPAHPLVNWGKITINQCLRGTSQPKAYAKYTLLKDGISAETAMADPLGWETIAIPCSKSAPAGDDVLRFRASGGGKTKSLLVEVRESDGSRWMAVTPVTRQERPIGLHVNQFKYWRDSTSHGRGGAGDHVHFEHAQMIAVGLAESHQPLEAGRYRYTVRGLATGKLGSSFARPQPLKLEGLSPAYKTFKAHPSRFEALGPVKEVAFNYPNTVISPVARGMRKVVGRDYVWQPLVKAFNADGVWCATPVSTMWRNDGATWTYLGFIPKTGPLAQFCRVLAATLPHPPKFEEGVGPLLDSRAAGDCVKVEGDHFVLGGKRWFAQGINFWPLYVSGLEPTEYFHNWLAPRFYYPNLIEEDLDTLEKLGVNLVSIQYSQPAEAPQLRDFLVRCGRHNIKANIFLAGAHPILPSATDDLSKRPFLKLLKAAHLSGNPNVFGYDLAWEPIVGAYAARKRLDPLFNAWVVEQYGSVARAERVWGVSANRDNGAVTGPSDKQLTEDGPQRVMVAAYRRFLDDLISRRYGEVIRLARTVDATHLFGARTGYGGTGTPGVVPNMPFQLTSGAAHLDFISPEGYGYGPKNISDAALVNQYARWAGHGKPVFWAEFGMSVWNSGQAGLNRQGDLYSAFAHMALRAGAAGWAPWWYPGGYRVDERSDYGIIAPDRSLRPSAEVMRRMASQLKMGGTLPAGPALRFSRDANPEGIAAVVRNLSKRFGQAYRAGRLPTLRTRGTGTNSETCPLTGVGGVAYTVPGPVEYLDSELWVAARENGRLRVTLLNTGEAAWLASDCVLRVDHGGASESVALPADVGPFGRVTVECADPGVATLALRASRFGAFGERLHVTK